MLKLKWPKTELPNSNNKTSKDKWKSLPLPINSKEKNVNKLTSSNIKNLIKAGIDFCSNFLKVTRTN